MPADSSMAGCSRLTLSCCDDTAELHLRCLATQHNFKRNSRSKGLALEASRSRSSVKDIGKIQFSTQNGGKMECIG
ncbi:hypothetical protein E2C01_026566 [Portunus trituberculatus]|uniref:Uncharacterized protein n=1 Tax=Portunus trituberculatus TaxID=210409 RepID=A0A5B7ELB3_PORTR|nr:hypothetical protein [Portunus trituberculatus]